MLSLSLPDGWRETTIWNCKEVRADGVLARTFFLEKRIEYYPRWWLAPIWPFIRPFVMAHERGHAHGLQGHFGCCIMFEHGDNWLEKPLGVYYAVLGRIKNGDWFCPDCRKILS